MSFVLRDFGNGHFGQQTTAPGDLELARVNGAAGFNLNVASNSDAIVDIASGALTHWVGGFTVQGGGIGVAVGGNWQNTSSTINTGGSLFVQSHITGADGTFWNSGKLEFLTGQGDMSEHVNTVGGTTEYAAGPGKMQNTLDFGKIVLDATHADSYSQANGSLALFNHGQLVSSMSLIVVGQAFHPSAFGVQQVGNSVVIHEGANFADPNGANLPLHV